MLSAEAISAWREVLARIEKSTNTQQFSTWFRSLELRAIDDEQIVITVPSRFHRDWIATYYRSILEASVADALGSAREISLEIRKVDLAAGPAAGRRRAPENTVRPRPEPVEEVEEPEFSLAPSPLSAPAPVPSPVDSPLIEGMDFEGFVVGPCNQLAHAAGLSLATSKDHDFSTMLVLGGVGLGKTHLLQAICRKAAESGHFARVAYVRGESFLNDFLQALAVGDTAGFRQRYRSLDFICFDDLQLLSGKAQSQQEFRHTLTAWIDRGARVVFAASGAAGGSLALDSQVLSQLSLSFKVTLKMPEPVTRRSLCEAKARVRGEQLPEDVAAFLAHLPISSIRELEGAVTSLIASARLTGTALTLRHAKVTLQDDALTHRPSASPERIIRTVCEHFEVAPTDIHSRRRPQALSFARHVAMFLLRERTELSLSEIGGALGGRDHTTVLHGIRKIEGEKETDSRLRDHLGKIRGRLEA